MLAGWSVTSAQPDVVYMTDPINQAVFGKNLADPPGPAMFISGIVPDASMFAISEDVGILLGAEAVDYDLLLEGKSDQELEAIRRELLNYKSSAEGTFRRGDGIGFGHIYDIEATFTGEVYVLCAPDNIGRSIVSVDVPSGNRTVIAEFGPDASYEHFTLSGTNRFDLASFEAVESPTWSTVAQISQSTINSESTVPEVEILRSIPSSFMFQDIAYIPGQGSVATSYGNYYSSYFMSQEGASFDFSEPESSFDKIDRSNTLTDHPFRDWSFFNLHESDIQVDGFGGELISRSTIYGNLTTEARIDLFHSFFSSNVDVVLRSPSGALLVMEGMGRDFTNPETGITYDWAVTVEHDPPVLLTESEVWQFQIYEELGFSELAFPFEGEAVLQHFAAPKLSHLSMLTPNVLAMLSGADQEIMFWDRGSDERSRLSLSSEDASVAERLIRSTDMEPSPTGEELFVGIAGPFSVLRIDAETGEATEWIRNRTGYEEGINPSTGVYGVNRIAIGAGDLPTIVTSFSGFTIE